MFAIISDIHGNLEALDAVLADIARRPVSSIYCLGDLVGYGPDSIPCLERAVNWDVVILGEFDQGTIFDNTGFMPRFLPQVEHMLTVVRETLDTTHREDLWSFLAARPHYHRDGDFLFVHGSPRNPINEYIFPEDIDNQRKMNRIAEIIECYCFCGHTHVPGVFVQPEEADGPWEFFAPDEINHFWRFDGRKAIVNVGSVGQPRDGDWRACYVTVDGWDVTFHRVEYNVNATVAKVYAIPYLDNMHGDRLRDGR